MLHEYLQTNRSKLIDRCRKKVARRSAPQATQAELEFGVPLFLDQLIETLRMEQASNLVASRSISGAAGGERARGDAVLSEIGESAKLHGRALLQQGFTIDQVVHDYGDLCQAITDLAFEENATVEVGEFRTLNRCLDNAIAGAVTEFSAHRDASMETKAKAAGELDRTDVAGQLKEKVHIATMALAALRTGKVGLTGATGAVLETSLAELRVIIDELHSAFGSAQAIAPAPDSKLRH